MWGGAWFVGNVGPPSSSAPRADHLDSRGFEVYDVGSAGVAALSHQKTLSDHSNISWLIFNQLRMVSTFLLRFVFEILYRKYIIY